jgi:hypothetical protein
MKKTLFLVFSIVLLFAGCTKEAPVQDEYDRLKSAKLPIPIDFSFKGNPDFTVPTLLCTPPEINFSLPGKIWISGSTDLLGEIDAKNSYMLNTSCDLEDLSKLREDFEGRIYISNGDYFNTKGRIVIDVSNAMTAKTVKVEGEIKVDGGTGKFVGVKGSIFISGTVNFDNGSMTWDGDGTFDY